VHILRLAHRELGQWRTTKMKWYEWSLEAELPVLQISRPLVGDILSGGEG
jgi:hypothetical protein